MSRVAQETDSGTCGERLSVGLHVMAKPIGPICNLDCAYCYYLDKERLYPGATWRMGPATLDAFVRQYIDAQSEAAGEIVFAWQGGEPTLLDPEFFEEVVRLQQRYLPPGRRCSNTLQTNGLRLDDRWCELFKRHGFLVGISLDGPAELHDRYRVDKQGRPTFAAAWRGLEALQRHQVDYNVLVVVHRHNGDHGRRIYRFFRQAGVRHLQLIPLVEPLGNRACVGVGGQPADMVNARSVLPEQYGEFLSAIFDEWVYHDVGRVFVQIFDEALASWLGREPSLCVFRRRCGRALAIEHNGDVYSCDHFVEPDYRLGNIHQLPLVELADSPRQRQFGEAKETSLPGYCRQCDVRFACHGECPKNRILHTPDGEPGLNYLCAAYQRFFRHIDPVMRAMADEVRAGRSPAGVMHRLRAARQAAESASQPSDALAPQRNAPCPCGSGRKFKHCCQRSR
jgi:uncharacterized protein